MSCCTSPLRAWRSSSPPFKKMVFSEADGLASTEVLLPCGQCIACRLSRARQWAHRCVHEASLHAANSFLTLTYNDEELVYAEDGPTLYHRHVQLFFKSLRKAHPGCTIRYFMCGEYGPKLERPHYHCCIFGYSFPDKEPFRRSGSFFLYRSAELSRLWQHGFHTIGDLSFHTACYTARYLMKKVTGDFADSYYGGRRPEYIAMSRRPGIGRDWYNKYKSDLYNDDICVTSNTFISKPPKYYDNILKLEDEDLYNQIKAKRSSFLDTEVDFLELMRQAEFNCVRQSRLSRSYDES